jgi:hypothetical protein
VARRPRSSNGTGTTDPKKRGGAKSGDAGRRGKPRRPKVAEDEGGNLDAGDVDWVDNDAAPIEVLFSVGMQLSARHTVPRFSVPRSRVNSARSRVNSARALASAAEHVRTILESEDDDAMLADWTERLRRALRVLLAYDRDLSKRDLLIDLVEKVAEWAAGPLRTQAPVTDEERVHAGPAEAAEGVIRTCFAILYPDDEEKLDSALLVNAIQAWKNPPGRPRQGVRVTSKWDAIAKLVKSAFDDAADPVSIERDWMKRRTHRARKG